MLLFDSYTHFKEEPSYKKIVGEDYLIVEFKCPIEDENFHAWSECHYITYVLSGKKSWMTHNNKWTLGSGESIFVKKGAYMNRQFLNDKFCVLMFFMTDDFIKKFVQTDMLELARNGSPKGTLDPLQRIEVSESLSTLYNSFFSYLRQNTPTPEKIIELKFREMLLNILSNPNNNGVGKLIQEITAFDKSPIPKVMEDNFSYNLNLDAYARLCGRSLSSFKRDFKKHFDISPKRWLLRRRLVFAKQLLLGTEQTVQEVCYDAGFENPSHFNRVFKEQIGQTPLDFRKNGPQNLIEDRITTT
jgi:AraC-like DNA-binding protein